ncbi:hypothetical protein Pmani_038868 [Petrolisthes manimaculis]|uniref:Uncharacterized protein n=1 Tax=Petrolisthes manimaculis TaxID=1843537 RepID=A0AAE1NDJ6_9EUCA|nr:hypothetical protein Pmani_038868 [Petrolisthes manimaculis]
MLLRPLVHHIFYHDLPTTPFQNPPTTFVLHTYHDPLRPLVPRLSYDPQCLSSRLTRFFCLKYFLPRPKCPKHYYTIIPSCNTLIPTPL